MIYVIIVDIDTADGNPRKFCEKIENMRFTSEELFLERLRECGATREDLTTNIKLYNLSDYMDGVNNQELDVLTNSFISYVHLEYER